MRGAGAPIADGPLWSPDHSRQSSSAMARFRGFVEQQTGLAFKSYESLHGWSIQEGTAFWSLLAEFTQIFWQMPPRGETFVQPGDGMMRGGRWFPHSRLNFAENLLIRAASENDLDSAEAPVVIAVAEGCLRRVYTRSQLIRAVAAATQALKRSGVAKGDRVAGVLINGPEALICMLATAAIGAVWASCSPDFGAEAIVDRLVQTDPKVVFFSRAYRYGGKSVDCSKSIDELRHRLPGLRHLVTVNHLEKTDWEAIPESIDYQAWLDLSRSHKAGQPALTFEPMEFMDPLFIMFSSGTTGVPKCIVHSVGGTLLQHKKEQMLHGDIAAGSRLLFFTTCGWMMWNWMASALATGASLVLYDGSPAFPDAGQLWHIVADEGVTHFGTSPKYISACMAASFQPAGVCRLEKLRTVFATGAPLLPEHYRWIYREVGSDIHLASISGGTDIISCFALGNPELPVWPGEIQCIGLGMAVEAWNDAGQPVTGEKGELICTRPFVSMPTMFWNDPEGKKFKAAYFEHFSVADREVWRHGDYIEVTTRGSVIVYGRSDATLNPGGVRIGTAELYRQVETMTGIADSIAVGQRFGDDTRIILFVKLLPGVVFDEALEQQIRKRIRQSLSPRHVPALILPVTDIPYTRSGKKMEIAVTQVIHGEPVPNLAAIANPESLTEFVIDRKDAPWATR